MGIGSVMSLSDSTLGVKGDVKNLLDIGTQCIDWIDENKMLSLCFAGCIIPIGFKVIKAALRTVKR